MAQLKLNGFFFSIKSDSPFTAVAEPLSQLVTHLGLAVVNLVLPVPAVAPLALLRSPALGPTVWRGRPPPAARLELADRAVCSPVGVNVKGSSVTMRTIRGFQTRQKFARISCSGCDGSGFEAGSGSSATSRWRE